MKYKPLKIETIEVGGLVASLQAMRLPKGSKNDSVMLIDTPEFWKYPSGKVALEFGSEICLGQDDARLAGNLIRAGDDHAKAMRGIIVWAELEMQTGFMIELETYRLGSETLSTSSTMHNELKGMSGPELASKKQEGLPEKVYKRIASYSYQTLRRIYKARRNHRHPDWKIFCEWIEGLPYFKELIEAKK